MTPARTTVVVAACLIPAGIAALAAQLTTPAHAPTPPPPPTPAPIVAVAPPPPRPKSVEPPPNETAPIELGSDEALSSALARIGTSPADVSALLRALKGKVDLRALRQAGAMSVEKHPRVGAAFDLVAFDMKTLSPEGVPRSIHATRHEAAITADNDDVTYAVDVRDAVIETKVEGVTGSVRSSLYQAMTDAGEDANLVNRFADVFAWNIDFYRQTREGDQFKVLVEKRTAGGRFLGYGRVLAAEYVNAGAVYRGFRFDSKDGKFSGTFDDEGQALQRAFLKQPMEITRVTSSYGMRFHPLNKGEQFHHGIDYGAPLGTPIWTVADGVVEMAKYNGGAGNMVKIKHMNGFETEFFHMSRFADGMKPGVRVKQKQVIGYVGSTGSSTGPHLHFGMFKNGDHVDPQKQKLPNVAPVTKAYDAEFHKYVEPLLEQLHALDRV